MSLFAQLPDLHIGLRGRESQVESALAFIAGDLEKHPVDLVLMPGDVFDMRSTPAARNTLAQFLRRLRSRVAIIPGNHDADRDLTIFSKLDHTCGITVCEQPEVFKAGGFVVNAFPHMPKGLLSTEGTITESNRTSEDILRGYFRSFAAELPECQDPRILMLHADIAGRTASNGETRPHLAITVSVADVLLSGADHVAAGHIHLLQRLDPRVWYGGSASPSNWGESHDPKGYLLGRIERRGQLPEIQVREIPTRKMITVEAKWAEDGWAIEPGPGSVPPDAEVRVRISAPEDHASELAQAQADALDRWPDAKVESSIIPTSRIRSQDVADAETFRDMLVAYWKATETPAPEFQQKAFVLLEEFERQIAA
jgi:DNA repair exonuclease SbcCD nuclease subunit